jgi:hypothetical protein
MAKLENHENDGSQAINAQAEISEIGNSSPTMHSLSKVAPAQTQSDLPDLLQEYPLEFVDDSILDENCVLFQKERTTVLAV